MDTARAGSRLPARFPVRIGTHPSAQRPGRLPGRLVGDPPGLIASLWSDQLGGPIVPRPPLAGDQSADVCVVGAGFTGLWTAYYLARLDPTIRVVVVERAVAGFGASGRNGGWCSALWPGDGPPRPAGSAHLAGRFGRPPAGSPPRAEGPPHSGGHRGREPTGGRAGMNTLMRPALAATIDEIGAVAAEEGIDCDFDRSGTLRLATTPAQAARLRAQAGDAWLTPEEVATTVRVAGALGGVFDPECAALQPAKLVRGLADAVERRGATVYEATAARRISPGLVVTDGGTVSADVIIRATEAYTAALPGQRRELAPVYSLVIATEPLGDTAWEEIGWRQRATLADARHLIIYAQRTVDGRIVLGGRGAPYHPGSKVRPAYDLDRTVFDHLGRTLRSLFPAAAGATVTHAWGGPLAIPRDWVPTVSFDPSTGLGAAGGYVGDGVAASALAGRTLAELVCGRQTERTRLPWVNHHRRAWEPEPLRWIGINGARMLAAAADARENRTGRPSILGTAVARLTGH